MKLPEFLTADDGGFIHAAGHRIGLHHVIRLYSEGYSPEMLVGEYPTLPLALVHKMIAFYLENLAEVDAYMAAHDREIEWQMAEPRRGPTFAELRARFEAIRRAEARPNQPAAHP